MPVLKGYYTAFNTSTKQFGLGTLVTSSKAQPVAGTAPSIEMPTTDMPVWASLFIALVSGVILALALSLLIKFLFCGDKPEPDG